MAFGAAGVVLGPVVLAIAVALADVWRQRMSDGTAAEKGVDAENAALDISPAPQRGRKGGRHRPT